MNGESFEPQVSPSVRRRPRLRTGGFLFVLTTTGFAAAGQNQWALTGGGSWNNTNNWSAGAIPNAAGASVLIGPGLLSAPTITLGSLTRVGDLTLDSGLNISVIGTSASRLTFAESPLTSEALLAALGGGSHSVSHVGLESNLRVDVDSGTAMNWSGAVYGANRTIRKTGGGLLEVASGTSLSQLTQTLWNIEGGTVLFGGGSIGGSGSISNSLALDGGTAQFAGVGLSVLQGGWNFGAGGGTVAVGSGRIIQVTGPVSGSGTFTKTGAGSLAFTGTSGSTFSGDVRFLEGSIYAYAAGGGSREYIIRGAYEDVPTARYFINGQSSTANLVRNLTFENGRTNVVTATINLAANARGGIAASGPGTVVDVENFIQSADAANQTLYLSTRNGGVLILGAGANIDSALATGDGRTSQYWDDGTGQLRLAPGFVADYAPGDPATGWTGLDVFGGTLVSSESRNLPEFLRFNAPRVAAENRWITVNEAQAYASAAAFNGNTRITTVTDLTLTGASAQVGVQLTKDGPGTLVLASSTNAGPVNPIAGPVLLAVEEGTLQAGLQYPSAANLNVTVSAGATVTGDGRMGTLAVSGTVAPGRPGMDFASLTSVGVALDGQATFEVDLGTDPVTDVDRLVVEGAIFLDGQLSVTLLAEPTPFVEYVIVDNRFILPVIGTFDQGSSVSADFGGITYPFDILYNGGDGNDVILLTVVPEPGAASLALLGAGVWLLGRRAARRK